MTKILIDKKTVEMVAELLAVATFYIPALREKRIVVFDTVLKALKQSTEQEPVAVKRMMEWVDYLKRKSDYGQHLQISSEMSAGACWDLARELEQFIAAQPQEDAPLITAGPITPEMMIGPSADEKAHIVNVMQSTEQEPVGEVENERGDVDWISFVPPTGTKLYTQPQEAAPRKPLTSQERDAHRWRFLMENSYDRESATQFHVWEHSWEPHSQTGEPTEWKQRVGGIALIYFIDRAIEAAHGITGEKE